MSVFDFPKTSTRIAPGLENFTVSDQVPQHLEEVGLDRPREPRGKSPVPPTSASPVKCFVGENAQRFLSVP